MLEVRLLGTFSIQHDGRSVVIASRAAQSLFAYLIMTAGDLHRREKLAGMFWPDATEEKARTYLRHELWRIRKILSEQSKENYVRSDEIHISFDASCAYWLDVDILRRAGASADPQDLMDALSAYGGELLPGFYDDWVIQEREYSQTLYEQKMVRLLKLLEEEQQWSDILEWGERWLSQNHGSEQAYRGLMVASEALGDRARVASMYERYVRAMRELDLGPSEEMRALAFKRTHALHLPIPLTSFIGRESELREVAALLSGSRLVTLTGSGGIGKTRLAIQVVAEVLEEFPDGVWFLDLASLHEPALIPNTLASLLGLSEVGDTRVSVTDRLINYFASRTALIIFDNCEHLIEDCAQLVHGLLASCEHLSVLATSREALRIEGEIPYRVPSLEIPRPDVKAGIEALVENESVRLFVARARVVSPGFELSLPNALVVAQICRQLDGIPLAIELAAARANVLTVEQIAQRLDDRFNLLTRGLRTALPRHQTLRATIDWSYDLLPDESRLLFRRLSVFAGGFTLESAEQICSAEPLSSHRVLDLVARLVDQSLVIVDQQDAERRYRMLETIREYGREKLVESGELARLQAAHLDFFLKLVEKAEPKLDGAEQVAWMDRLEREYDNLRAAFDWALQSDLTAAFRLAGAQGWFWYIRGHLSEGLEGLQKLLAGAQGWFRYIRGHLSDGVGGLQNLLGHPLAPKGTAPYAKVVDLAGLLLLNLGREVEARALFEEAIGLWRDLDDRLNEARAVFHLGLVIHRQGDPATAQSLLEQALALCRSLGPPGKHETAWLLAFLGVFLSYREEFVRAEELFAESIALSREVEDLNLEAFMLRHWGFLALHMADHDRAAERFKESLRLNLRVKHKQGIAASLSGLGALAAEQGFAARAICLFGIVKDLLDTFGSALLDADAFEYESHLIVARATLSEADFATAWACGHAMPFDEAIAYALEERQ